VFFPCWLYAYRSENEMLRDTLRRSSARNSYLEARVAFLEANPGVNLPYDRKFFSTINFLYSLNDGIIHIYECIVAYLQKYLRIKLILIFVMSFVFILSRLIG
jgi:hypothetical protein